MKYNIRIPELPPKIIKKMVDDRAIRTSITKGSHYLFFNTYFSHYVKFPTANFQREMFALTEDPKLKNICLVAFRGSAKSTIFNLSLPLWSILGKPQCKNVLLLGQTQAQARQHLKNIKEELEHNELLRSDLGPFREEEDQWHSSSLVITNYGTRITAASSEQSIRGFRHGQYRPDLIVGDDLEDLGSVKSKESRDKLFGWLTGDIIPLGDRNTRLVLIGNLLHDNSLLMRIKKSIEDGNFNGVYKAYPLLDKEGKILWPGKYPSMKEVEEEKSKIISTSAWQREFLLKIVTDEEQLVPREWIKTYHDIPEAYQNKFRFAATGIDLAISEKLTADFTAMVSAKVYGSGQNMRIYIQPNPINKRIDFPSARQLAKQVSTSLGNGDKTWLFVENVGYQDAFVQDLVRDHYLAEGFPVHGQDKHARFAIITHLIKSGQILFAEQGNEDLISQVTTFPKADHDDLLDAFVLLIHKIIEKQDTYDRSGVIFAQSNLFSRSHIHLGEDDSDDGGYDEDEEW